MSHLESLPSYSFATDPIQTPSYSAQPHLHETRLAEGHLPSPYSVTPSMAPRRPAAEFVKDSRRGGLRLRLSGQASNVTVPVFGIREPVEGAVELLKPEGLVFVAVRVRVHPPISISPKLKEEKGRGLAQGEG